MAQIRCIGIVKKITFGQMSEGRKGLGNISLDAGLGKDGSFSPVASIAFSEEQEDHVRAKLRTGEVAEFLISTPVSKKTGASWLIVDAVLTDCRSAHLQAA